MEINVRCPVCKEDIDIDLDDICNTDDWVNTECSECATEFVIRISIDSEVKTKQTHYKQEIKWVQNLLSGDLSEDREERLQERLNFLKAKLAGLSE